MTTTPTDRNIQKRIRFLQIIAIIVLVLYNLTPRIDSFDTAFYLMAGENIFDGKLDCLRTPVYPFLLKGFELLFGYKGMTLAITILQSIIYLFSASSLYALANRVISNQNIIWGALLLYVTVMAPGWCNELSTESLSISGTIIVTNMLLGYISRTDEESGAFTFGIKLSLYNISIHLLVVLLIFLRPTFILFLAILPCLWIYQAIQTKQIQRYLLPLLCSILCISCYWGYNQLYKNQYGIATSTISFECNTIYNLKRSNCWDLAAVINKEGKEICTKIDKDYTCNYEPIYQLIDNEPGSLPILHDACQDMIQAHKTQYRNYRIQTFCRSFESRFPGAVNTHSRLGIVLFFINLFLAIPLSIFYLIVPLSIIILFRAIFMNRKIPIAETLIIGITAAQYIGIAFSASEAHARLMSPVYGLFIIILAIGLDKIINFQKTEY